MADSYSPPKAAAKFTDVFDLQALSKILKRRLTLDSLITTKEAAEILRLNPNTIQKWRMRGEGPPFEKLGSGRNAAVRYSLRAVLEWRQQREYNHTAAYGTDPGSLYRERSAA